LIGVFCLLSLVPIKIGNFELRPLIFQITNQLMPRPQASEQLTAEDEQRLRQKRTNITTTSSTNNGTSANKTATTSKTRDKSKVLDWVYTHMSKFRNDLRILTALWGIMLIVGFIVKAVIATRNEDISKAQNFGYYFFTLATLGMIILSWLYTKIMKKHVKDQADNMQKSEGYNNVQWGIQAMSNGFNQVVY
jgi:hypothetical protein